MRFIVDQGCGYLHSCFGISLSVVVLLCVGNPDLWDRGLVCFWGTFLCGLFTPINPSPGHRLVPESQVISRTSSMSRRSVVDEEAILGNLRSGEGLVDYDYEHFEAGSTGRS